MADRAFLVFRLRGPLAAFGDIAVGERRSTWDVPSKSAVLGLLGAGLGLDRGAADDHARLDRGVGFAVRQDRPGRPLRDYHTAQAPKARKGVRWTTRKAELEASDLNTVLSERLYLIDPIFTVALWLKPQAAVDLDALAEAMRRPHFTPYLGRKACPLGAPPRPRVIEAGDLNAAFAAYDAAESDIDAVVGQDFRHRHSPDRPPVVWFETDAGLETPEAAKTAERRTRRDGLMNRALWQFTDRAEARFTYEAPIFGEGDA